MRRERVSDDIYVFTSDLYAQVTASAVVTREGIVVIDTLPFPVETIEMIEYLDSLGQGPIKYLVNTHWHGDHTNGNCVFDDSIELVCHKRCQQAIEEFGPEALQNLRKLRRYWKMLSCEFLTWSLRVARWCCMSATNLLKWP